MFHKLSGKFTQCNPKTEHREMATYQLQTTGEQTDEAMRRALRPQNVMQGDETASGAYVLTDAEGKAFDPQTSASAVLMGDGTTLDAELGYKDHVAYILKDFTKSYYNNTGSDITDRSMVVTPTQSGVTSNFSLTSRVMECNAWSTTEGYKKISASGCTLTKHAEDVDYQTTTAIIPQNTTVNVRRRNGADSQLAGCDNEVFLEYYRENGTTGTDILPGSSTIIRESVFTQTDNPALVAAYPTYRDYLFGEHLAQYPSAYGAFLQDGKSNTAILAGKTRTDFYGKTVPCYPAAAAAAAYGMQVAGMTTGLEAGAWWLPSAEELWLMCKGLIFAQPYDPVNRTLSVSGKVIAKTDYMASSTEYSSLYYFQVNQYGNTRWMLQQQGKSISSIVRPVSEL